MRFATLCSGIESPSVAWAPLGWECAFTSEIEPFPCHVLNYRHGASRPRYMPRPEDAEGVVEYRKREAAIRLVRNLPEESALLNLGDMMQIRETDLEPFRGTIDALCAGTPCQSFSIAGLRKGLDDARGNLALRYFQICDRIRPRWVIWENVAGVLSSDGGRDLRRILGAFNECGYGWAYRILDAQYFGVPQRRRRIFLVGYLGDWRFAAAVLFERDSLRRHLAASGTPGQEIAGCLGGGAGSRGYPDDLDRCGAYIPRIAGALAASNGSSRSTNLEGHGAYIPNVAHTLRGEGHDASEDGTGLGSPLVVDCLTASPQVCNAEGGQWMLTHSNGAKDVNNQTPLVVGGAPSEVAPSMGSQMGETGKGDAAPCVAGASGVRRLTPREWERLMGFPDDYTLIPWRGDMAPDSPRYKALGNSKAVPVVKWIGERIKLVEEILREVQNSPT